MYFKNETSEFEILILGHTEFPQFFEEDIGKNALSCQVCYCGKECGTGVLWDELFQTDDIVRLHDMTAQLADGIVDSFEYTDPWDMVRICARCNEGEYQFEVGIVRRGVSENMADTFAYSRQELEELVAELETYKTEYPVIE